MSNENLNRPQGSNLRILKVSTWDGTGALFQNVSRNGRRFSILCIGFQFGCPLRKVVQRVFMRAIKLERRNGSGSLRYRGIITLGIESFDVLLLQQPKIAPPARARA